MNLNQLMRLKDINYWFLASAIALNVFWSLMLTVVFSLLFLRGVQGGETLIQVLMIAVSFLGSFLVGWIVGLLAADGRGPIYGIYGSFGSIAVLSVVAVPAAGLLGLMMIVVALAGGFNGGMLSIRGRRRD